MPANEEIRKVFPGSIIVSSQDNTTRSVFGPLLDHWLRTEESAQFGNFVNLRSLLVSEKVEASEKKRARNVAITGIYGVLSNLLDSTYVNNDFVSCPVHSSVLVNAGAVKSAEILAEIKLRDEARTLRGKQQPSENRIAARSTDYAILRSIIREDIITQFDTSIHPLFIEETFTRSTLAGGKVIDATSHKY